MKYLGAPYRTKAIRCENGTVTALGGAREMVKWELEGNGLASNRLVFGASKEIDGKKSGGTTHQVPHDDKVTVANRQDRSNRLKGSYCTRRTCESSQQWIAVSQPTITW